MKALGISGSLALFVALGPGCHLADIMGSPVEKTDWHSPIMDGEFNSSAGANCDLLSMTDATGKN
jgi:hypothetical protein